LLIDLDALEEKLGENVKLLMRDYSDDANVKCGETKHLHIYTK
jgi:hypothetical protein